MWMIAQPPCIDLCIANNQDLAMTDAPEKQIFKNRAASALGMWSTVVMFVLTFAILGLLLGFAEIYDPSEGEEPLTSDTSESTANVTSTLTVEDKPSNGNG